VRAGLLGGKTTSLHTPGVRCRVSLQSGAKRGQEEPDKGRIVLGFDQGSRREGCGVVVLAGVLVSLWRHAMGVHGS
jgi:hypothetical protein